MKPGILNIIYFVLGYLSLSSALQIYEVFKSNISNGYSILYIVSLSTLVVIGSLVAIFAFIKRIPWAKWASLVVVGLPGMLSIVTGVYLMLINPEIVKVLLITTVPKGLAFLFLAYKIYTSKPLKHYLENA